MRQPRAAQRTNGAQRAHPTLATVSTADVAHTRPVLRGAAHVARPGSVLVLRAGEDSLSFSCTYVTNVEP
jgi:hypothetical protein